MNNRIPEPLIVLEMANNHMGNIRHGLEVIREFGAVCRKYSQFSFAFKLQYRDLETFIHPAMQGRDDVKYIKRFSETRLTRVEFDQLIAEMRANGFLTMSTPFDEASVDVIESQDLDIIKIASCSFTDWPLLEQIVKTDKPIIASTAGAQLEDIDRVISFFTHRGKEFVIMHCVGEYPTADDHLHLSQIDFLKERYPGIRIGFSTHEDPANTDIIKIAVAKGASVFEKHVGVPTDSCPLNAYSASPAQIDAWLSAASYARLLCGTGNTRLPDNPEEKASLRSLRRGLFARRPLQAGERLHDEDVYFAFPPRDDQFTASDYSKYTQLTATATIPADAPLSAENCQRIDMREKIWNIALRVKALFIKNNITIPGGTDLEISHHYGIERFDEFGLTMLTVVNRGYCKKLLVVLPNQWHPEQYHNQKEETFNILAGDVLLELDKVRHNLKPGDVVTVEPGVRHAFTSTSGAIIEEISSTHFPNDSYYTDETISQNPDRKTFLTYWMM
ncbi:MAG: N-acetylneuraminate synthase family protein [Pelobacteraceae bacterium]